MEARQATGRRTRDGGPELEADRRELGALQRRFRSIIERTADGILVVDRGGAIRFANPAASELFGRRADELVGTPFGTPISGDAPEVDVIRADGPRVAELRVMDTEWEGEPAQLISLRDVTDRKRADEQERRLYRERIGRAVAEERARRESFLSEASRRLGGSLALETTLESVAQLVVEELADVCVLDIAIAGVARRITAARPELEAVARAVERFPLEPLGELPQAEAYRRGEPLLVPEVTEAWLRQATRGPEHLAVARAIGPRSIMLVPLDSGHRRVGLLAAIATAPDRRFGERDLSLAVELGHRAAMALENAWLYEQAEAANRAKTNFLSVMSHELRTPLSAIIGYSDLIDRGVAGDATEKQKHFVGRIRASSKHLLQIIEEILAFAGTESGEEKPQPEETSLGEIVEAVVAVAEPLARDAGLEFRLELEEPRTQLYTDARKARQILLNLVSNAVKFTPAGAVVLRAAPDADDVVFQVEDTGVGIPADRQEEIFDKFWQVENPMTRRAGGTGLGLALSRSFARLLGGEVEVESVEGDGSVFTLRIPCRAPL